MKQEELTFNDLPQVVAQLRDEVMGMRRLLIKQQEENRKHQERLSWDVARLEKVVRTLETERRRFTADDVITMFHKQTKESSLFTFMHGVIAQLKQLGKVRTPVSLADEVDATKEYQLVSYGDQ